MRARAALPPLSPCAFPPSTSPALHSLHARPPAVPHGAGPGHAPAVRAEPDNQHCAVSHTGRGKQQGLKAGHGMAWHGGGDVGPGRRPRSACPYPRRSSLVHPIPRLPCRRGCCLRWHLPRSAPGSPSRSPPLRCRCCWCSGARPGRGGWHAPWRCLLTTSCSLFLFPHTLTTSNKRMPCLACAPLCPSLPHAPLPLTALFLSSSGRLQDQRQLLKVAGCPQGLGLGHQPRKGPGSPGTPCFLCF